MSNKALKRKAVRRTATPGVAGGYRIMGSRKASLINGPLRKQLERLSRIGIDGTAYVKRRYGVYGAEGFLRINTKRISGIISDLAELG